MTNTTTTGVVELSTSWKASDFESESSSPKDISLLTYLFFLGGGGGGVGMVNLLLLGTSEMTI